jgi:hypothetical protein
MTESLCKSTNFRLDPPPQKAPSIPGPYPAMFGHPGDIKRSIAPRYISEMFGGGSPWSSNRKHGLPLIP